MLVGDLVLLCEDRFNMSTWKHNIDHVFNLGSDNETMKAIAQRFETYPRQAEGHTLFLDEIQLRN